MSHSRSIFDHIAFSDSIPAEYLWNVCKNPILDAELATPCGHSFCGFCVDMFKKTSQGQSSTCEMCRQPVTAFCSNRLGLRKSSAQTRIIPQNIKPTPNGMVTVFTWTLPAAKLNAVMHSPIFEKWERQWCILVDTNDCTYLQYSQGADSACVSVSFTLRKAGEKARVYIVPVVKLSEGKMVRLANKMPQNTAHPTMKLEMLVPEIVQD
ncbi:hypothetical protein AWC38_SpisGene14310 [Stylophora pistillata]|uniref:RING-type domain-containing protein n=1 Tax=Stylophora pistillata TaxID=50429 RepID=A0A2B4RUD2_STYPI|nr:hypothetical protein AWC38_SpisGene14310 [Stylophora pistillata]